MSADPRAAFMEEDASSGGSGDDANKRLQPGGRRKRSRKATGDAIVDAMLQIASASKMRAAAIMKNNEDDPFSITKCIKNLDEMQGLDQRIYFYALDLFENPNARETFISLKPEKRFPWLQKKSISSSSALPD